MHMNLMMVIILLTHIHKNENYVTRKVNLIGRNTTQSAQARSSDCNLIREEVVISDWSVPRVSFSV